MGRAVSLHSPKSHPRLVSAGTGSKPPARIFRGAQDDEDAEDPLEQIPDSSTPAPDGEVQRKRACAELEVALRALPLRQQQAFLLRIWEELDVAQTARAMGCSEGSVKTHLFRALQVLRQRLGEHWP